MISSLAMSAVGNGAPATKTLVLFCCALYIGEFSGLSQKYDLIHLLGNSPRDVVQRMFLWQPITYLFLHANWFHLISNMWMLWTWGRPLESRWGAKRFLGYFLLTGIGTGLFLILLNPTQSIPTIGCSGSLCGIIMAQVLLWRAGVRYALIFGACSFVAAFAAPNFVVNNAANLGGFLFGFVYLRQEGLPFGFHFPVMNLRGVR